MRDPWSRRMRNDIVFYVLVAYAPVSPFVLQTSPLHAVRPCDVPLFPSRFPRARVETPVGRRNGRAAYLMAVEQPGGDSVPSGAATPKKSPLERWRRWWHNWWETRGVAADEVNQQESLEAVSESLGCEAPLKAPAWVWKLAWEFFKAVIPVLHAFDRCRAGDTHLNLSVAWWKAIAGNRRGVSTSDGGLAWDLLPPVSRQIVRYPLCLLYPRLHHQNVALRTSYIDTTCRSEMQRAHARGQRVRLVSVGAGFDTRSFKMAAPDPLSLASLRSPSDVNLVVRSYELDLPEVIRQKTRVIEQRLLRRRPHLTPYAPTLIAADLNDPSPFFDILFEEIIKKEGLTRVGEGAGPGSGGAQSDVHTIFVCEALMIYLKAPEVLLRESARLARSIGSASLCFADRLPGVSGQDRRQEAHAFLLECGWELDDWRPKPGLARHMGVARLIN